MRAFGATATDQRPGRVPAEGTHGAAGQLGQGAGAFASCPTRPTNWPTAIKLDCQANGFAACYIRPLIYLAEGGWNLNLDTGKPHVGIAVWEWNNFHGAEAMEKGIRANVSSFTRHHPNVMMTKAKITGNYANSVLAKTEVGAPGL